jgi:hypothetical protein
MTPGEGAVRTVSELSALGAPGETRTRHRVTVTRPTDCLTRPGGNELWKPLGLGGNIVATLAAPDASDASGKPRKMDDSDAVGHICAPCTRLRALWGDFPVVVRVHSGA